VYGYANHVNRRLQIINWMKVEGVWSTPSNAMPESGKTLIDESFTFSRLGRKEIQKSAVEYKQIATSSIQ